MDIKEINYQFSPDEINQSSMPSALVDGNGIIFWANDNFQKKYPDFKNKNLISLFEIDINKISKEKSFQEIQLSETNNQFIRISKVSFDSEETGFLVEIITQISETKISFNDDLIKKLVDENDLKEFCSSFLSDLSLNIKADRSFLIIFDNNQIHDLISYGANQVNLQEFKKVISANLLPLQKWFSINKNIYISENDLKSIGYQINQLLESDFVFINPSYSENRIIALTLFTKDNKLLTSSEINILGSYSNLLAIGIDLISLKNKQKMIETQLTNSQKLETVGKLASGLAHDFNNLLASIFGSINLLKNKITDNPNALKLLDNIENCSVRARDLTKGILSFGKPTQQRKEIVFLDNVLNELLKVINQTFPKYIKINFATGDSLYKIVGNSTEIYQILLNLCVNAKEAISHEGAISVKAENFIVDDSNIFLVPFLNKGHYVKISVSDNGSGIDEENLTKIFEPYFSTKQKDTGSGLGLYVTSQLVKAMNGYINVESKLNEGTTFRIYFPAVMLKEQKVISSKEKIIMLADDEEMLNDLLGDLLESNGFYVLKVNNTKEVFRILSEEVKVDLLIIDYNLPEITGLECVGKLREMGFNMPVILASGAISFNNDEFIKARINQTLQKPYEFETILETIKRLLAN
jgi:signal transduction histidine kinase/CheY-like chemotaxis protein